VALHFQRERNPHQQYQWLTPKHQHELLKMGEAYLHTLFADLEDNELRDLQNEINREFHMTLQELMRLHNGMNLFNSQLSIYGLRTSYRRSEIDLMMQATL
jgi:hypothetical protein